ncbi:MAG: LysR family transcriptional regulator, partial [Kiloniellales bacterium]|nr:LysR family transcriptional regulator [Kiloniellales bacterium]
MNRTFIPSLSALLAFDAAARHGSFTKAAEELRLSQGAVSRQVQALEDRLGLRLFERQRQRVHLTAAGISYAEEVHPLLERLAAATVRAMSEKGGSRTLNLA